MRCRRDEFLSVLEINRTVGGAAATAIPPSGPPYSFPSYFRRTSRCPRTKNPRSASRLSQPSRVPIEAVSSIRPWFSSCRVSRANLATSSCPGGRNVSLRWRMGGLVLFA